MVSKMPDPVPAEEARNQIQGSCLCGAVKFSLSGSPLIRILCNCVSCKKTSGSLFQANNCYNTSVCSHFPPKCVTYTSITQQLTIFPLPASDAIKTYIDKSPESHRSVHRAFCSECGSRLWNTRVLVCRGGPFVEATDSATPGELSDHIFLSRSSSAEILAPLCT
ncbi:Mss4-like protein [Leptodontidium sp. MPI-SDFR-AT-0119]|nr:Mss4-like protein [Leptodontidium sp. MPI-SDFR-AT-0119]